MVDVDYFYQTNNSGTPDPNGWFKDSDGSLLPPPSKSTYEFVAQTIVSSSYGMMQIMYPTAVVSMNYNQNGVGLDPIQLFRPSINVNLGSGYLAKQYGSLNGVSQSFTSIFQYEQSLTTASAGYNAGTKNYNSKKALNYSIAVFNQCANYWINAEAIFGN